MPRAADRSGGVGVGRARGSREGGDGAAAQTPGGARGSLDGDPLESLGLDRHSALVYTHLCVHGASNAGTIAAATRLGRGAAYRALDRLVARGYVVTAGKWPLAYSPVDPDEVFARAISENRARLASIVDAAGVLTAWWEQRAASRMPASESFRELEGHATIAAAARRMVQRASQLVRVVDNRHEARGDVAALPAETFHDVIPRGVELRVVSVDPARCETAGAERGRREGDGTAFSWLLVVDDAQALILAAPTFAAGDAPPDLRATWTESRGLIAMAVALHDSFWTRAEAARARRSA